MEQRFLMERTKACLDNCDQPPTDEKCGLQMQNTRIPPVPSFCFLCCCRARIKPPFSYFLFMEAQTTIEFSARIERRPLETRRTFKNVHSNFTKKAKLSSNEGEFSSRNQERGRRGHSKTGAQIIQRFRPSNVMGAIAFKYE